ncbi:hypothetical protein C8J56DRAFT_1168537 [Mycena floridula]|nr:hypothetical protein C8J56DRAFT_1168537 [Mycena floridula]
MSSEAPDEVWLHIACHLQQTKDLSTFSRTSTRFLPIARSLLYRKVRLSVVHGEWEPRSRYGPDTLALLAREPSLARCTTELELANYPQTGTAQFSGLVNPGALANMTNLRKLTLVGSVFIDAEEPIVDEWIAALRSVGPHVLVVNEERVGVPSLGLSSHKLRDFPQFRELEWGSVGDTLTAGSVESLIQDMLSNTLATLEKLSLLFTMPDDDPELIEAFFRLRFPCLTSLTLGHWNSYNYGALPGSFPRFINAHSLKLQYLDLQYEVDWRGAIFFDSAHVDILNSDSLSNLTEFRGNARSLFNMAKVGLKCLKAIEKLTVGPGGGFDPNDDFDAMIHTLRRSGGHLSALKELNLNLSYWEDREKPSMIEAVHVFTSLSSETLEVWSGSLGDSVEWNAEELGELFAPFKKLRVLHLEENNVAQHKRDDMLRYISKVAAACLTLEEVRWQVRPERIFWLERGPFASGTIQVTTHSVM